MQPLCQWEKKKEKAITGCSGMVLLEADQGGRKGSGVIFYTNREGTRAGNRDFFRKNHGLLAGKENSLEFRGNGYISLEKRGFLCMGGSGEFCTGIKKCTGSQAPAEDVLRKQEGVVRQAVVLFCTG